MLHFMKAGSNDIAQHKEVAVASYHVEISSLWKL